MENPSQGSPSLHHPSVKTHWTEILTSRNYVANSGDSLAKETFIMLRQRLSAITTDGVLRVGDPC